MKQPEQEHAYDRSSMLSPYHEIWTMSSQQPFPTNGNNADMFKLPLRRDHGAMDASVARGGGQEVMTTSYTVRDVLNGRGQGVQRHPGNVKYRTLVYANKTLYAKCPRNDKIRISKAIVRAVRKTGGRFLDHDERTNIYTDVGDKKATDKTSQALREGQTKIRRESYENKITSIPMLPAPPVGFVDGDINKWEVESDGYFNYSYEVLQHLYKADENMTAEMALRPPPHSVATQSQFLIMQKDGAQNLVNVPNAFVPGEYKPNVGAFDANRPAHPANQAAGPSPNSVATQSQQNNDRQQKPELPQGRIVSLDVPTVIVQSQSNGMLPIQQLQQQQQQQQQIQQQQHSINYLNLPPDAKRPRTTPPSSGSNALDNWRDAMMTNQANAQMMFNNNNPSMMNVVLCHPVSGSGVNDHQIMESSRQVKSDILGKDSLRSNTSPKKDILLTNDGALKANTSLTESTPSSSKSAGSSTPLAPTAQSEQQQKTIMQAKDKTSVTVVEDIAQTLLRLAGDR